MTKDYEIINNDSKIHKIPLLTIENTRWITPRTTRKKLLWKLLYEWF